MTAKEFWKFKTMSSDGMTLDNLCAFAEAYAVHVSSKAAEAPGGQACDVNCERCENGPADPSERADAEQLTIADYEECLADKRRLVRELDVIWNGDDAAIQASLCDLVSQIADELPKLRAGLSSAPSERADRSLEALWTEFLWQDSQGNKSASKSTEAVAKRFAEFVSSQEGK